MASTGNQSQYAALIGDIVESRAISNRQQVQSDLDNVLRRENESNNHQLVSNLVITIGDEFQGLFSEPSPAFRALIRITDRMPQIQFRFGLGYGGIDTELKDNAIGMDGPCFYNAREALEAAKEEDRWALIKGLGTQELENEINSHLRLIGVIRSDWTPRQRDYATSMRFAESQKQVAERFAVSPPAVNRSLRDSHYEELLASEETLSQALVFLTTHRWGEDE